MSFEENGQRIRVAGLQSRRQLFVRSEAQTQQRDERRLRRSGFQHNILETHFWLGSDQVCLSTGKAPGHSVNPMNRHRP